MKYPTPLGVILILALALSACGPAAPATTVPVPTEAPATTAATTSTVEATSTKSVSSTSTSSAGTGTGTPGVPVTGAVTVKVANDPTLGDILVDGDGLTLYVFSDDTQNGTTSACTDTCATEWPPLVTEGDPVAGDGVDASMLGTITRDDGTTQVTYHGWPLYHSDQDTAPGDTNGQGMEGKWSVISPQGEPMMQ